MKTRTLWWLSLADVILLPAFILWFIWQLQYTARWTWVFFVVWLGASFLVHRDTAKTLGWRADNLVQASKQALVVLGLMAAGLLLTGIFLGASQQPLPHLFSMPRIGGYFAFCILQQIALNSLVQNRMLSLVQHPPLAAALAGAIFAACHWPNPVLVPLTLLAGLAMSWMFARVRNILPLALGQAVLGTLVSWALPMAWHHHLRIGPGYYHWPA